MSRCHNFPRSAYLVRDISYLHSLNVDALVNYYNDWGPSARTCLELARNHITPKAMEEEAIFAARKFVQTALPMIEGPNPSDASNVLFSIHPEDDSRDTMEAKIATDRILNIILRQLTWLSAAQQSEFFTMISGHPWLRSPLGNLYEKLIHVRLTADPSAKSLVCKSTTGDSILLPVVPRVVSLSGTSNLQNANRNQLPFYWRPAPTTFTSLDAIICTAEMIFLLQSTVSGSPDIKEQGLDFIRTNIPTCFWKNRRCYIVFVTPDEDRGIQLISKKYSILEGFPELELSYCVLPFGTSKFTSSQVHKLWTRKLDVRILLCSMLSC